ncbi:MAG: hypothetical protein ACRC2T_20690 [Thermoguttaceae bacterium]
MKKVVCCSLVALCSVLVFASVSSAAFCFPRACAPRACWTNCYYETECVPVDITVKVPVYEDVEQTYTVCEKVRATKEVEYTVDRGCWETYEVSVPVRKRCFRRCASSCGCGSTATACGAATSCGGCDSCESGCGSCDPCCFKTITCKRWVPNCVTETKEVCYWDTQMVEKTRMVKKFVGCEDQTRTVYKKIRVKKYYTCEPACDTCNDCGTAVSGCGCGN